MIDTTVVPNANVYPAGPTYVWPTGQEPGIPPTVNLPRYPPYFYAGYPGYIGAPNGGVSLVSPAYLVGVPGQNRPPAAPVGLHQGELVGYGSPVVRHHLYKITGELEPVPIDPPTYGPGPWGAGTWGR